MAALMSRMFSKLPRWMPWLMGVLFFLLYAAAAAPSIVEFFDDTLEFQLVLPTFGIAHPTGYPLYTILGGVWSRLLFPFGDWAWRVNLLSALLGAATVGMVCALAQWLVASASTEDPTTLAAARSPVWAGATAAILFGLGPVWQRQTTVAEVYALHNLLVAAILLTAFSLPAGDDPASVAAFARRMTLLFLLFALALAHHRTVLLLLPGLIVYFLWDARRVWQARRHWPLWLGAFLAPLLLYLYLPLRATAGVSDLNASYTNTWAGFWNHVLARQYSSFFADNPLAVTRSWSDWWALSVEQVGWIGVGLAAFGLISGLARPGRARRGWLFVALVGATNLVFALLYRVGDVEVFLLPVWLCVALCAGGGVAAVGRLLLGHPVAAVAVQTALVVAIIFAPIGRSPVSDRSQEWAAYDRAIAMTSATFPANSQVIGLEGEMTAIRYMQAALGRAAGVEATTANDEAQRRTLIAAGLALHRPVYVTRELPAIETQYSFGGDGALVRVWPRGQARPPAPQHPLREVMAEGALHLVGYDLRSLPETGAPTAELALYWQPQQELTQTFKVSLRAVDGAGNVLTTPDGEAISQDLFPLRMVAPTPSWLPGEIVRDVYHIPLPPHQADANLLVIVYDAETLAEAGRWQTSLIE